MENNTERRNLVLSFANNQQIAHLIIHAEDVPKVAAVIGYFLQGYGIRCELKTEDILQNNSDSK